MPLDINTIKPASLKAKNVATEEYVDSSIQDIDLSADLLYNNNEFASKLGYIGTGTTTPYEEMIADATAGKTIINGGRLNTELIEAGAINAGHIDAYAITGKTITGGTINGSEINGTVINGARINGAVIRASYLDLDGQLEVLTNYHLCASQAQLNALIASGKLGRLVIDADKLQNGGDAIYLASDDEWRIPSLSTISASTGYVPLPAGSIINSYIYAFNNTTAGTNKKAVSIRPMVGFGSGEFIKSNGNINPSPQYYPTGTPISVAYYISNIQIFKIDIYVELLSSMQGGVSNNRTRANVYSYGNGTSSGSVTTYSGYSSESFDTDSTTIIVNNVPLFGTVNVTLYSTTISQFVGLSEEGSWQTSGYGSFKVECSGNQDFIPFDWSSGTIYGAVLSQSAYARINGLFLNNMV